MAKKKSKFRHWLVICKLVFIALFFGMVALISGFLKKWFYKLNEVTYNKFIELDDDLKSYIKKYKIKIK